MAQSTSKTLSWMVCFFVRRGFPSSFPNLSFGSRSFSFCSRHELAHTLAPTDSFSIFSPVLARLFSFYPASLQQAIYFVISSSRLMPSSPVVSRKFFLSCAQWSQARSAKECFFGETTSDYDEDWLFVFMYESLRS